MEGEKAEADQEVKEWQIFVKGLQGKTNVIRLSPDASVEELLEKISSMNQIPVDVQRVLYASKQLMKEVNNKKMYLKDYNMQDQSTLFVVLRLKGGSDTGNNGKELDDLVERTTMPDMITWDDDKDNLRAKMPCGHAIGPESLTAFCQSLLSAGKYRFLCPYIDPENAAYCGAEWEYFIVRRYAVLSEEEQRQFETEITQNYLRKGCGIQECPKCSSLCEKINRNDIRVVCPLCTKHMQRVYEFCWYCLHDWKANGISICGNQACTGEDPRLGILRNAPKKVIVGVANCPARRACPSCGMLIEHEKACKHMACRCGNKFCFICLKPQKDGQYQCGAYNEGCEVAAVQTQIPGC